MNLDLTYFNSFRGWECRGHTLTSVSSLRYASPHPQNVADWVRQRLTPGEIYQVGTIFSDHWVGVYRISPVVAIPYTSTIILDEGDGLTIVQHLPRYLFMVQSRCSTS